jgi:hypothetical protein
MEAFLRVLNDCEAAGFLPQPKRSEIAEALAPLVRGRVYPRSLASCADGLFFLWRGDGGKQLGVLSAARLGELEGGWHEVSSGQDTLFMLSGPLSRANLAALQRRLPFLLPRTVGLAGSFGFGDRMGLATPGHVRAAWSSKLVPFFPQQSIREMVRTERTPQGVMDDAVWGAFQAGWDGGFGSDADHLKTTADVDPCASAGYTMFTVDPGDHVDNRADAATPAELRALLDGIPWDSLQTSWRDTQGRYGGKSWRIEGDLAISLNEDALARAVVKYGRAVAHTAMMYRHLADSMVGKPVELEMSVDETDLPTTPEEHFFVALELQRLGVEWVSLAPRFVGSFQKGVDYIGDLGEFERSFAAHAAIARHVGPYKLSLHSGSDKFSIYEIAARHTNGLLHVKTAGTSYLEALRVVALRDAALFREILAFALQRFEHDRATYHMSPSLDKVPAPDALADDELPGLLDQFDARQVLHVTFGSVMIWKDGGRYRFRGRLLRTLDANEDAYYTALQRHFRRHLAAYS